MINLHERMLPTSVGVEPATSWSPVGRRIQLSHRGRQNHWVLWNIMKYSKVPVQTPGGGGGGGGGVCGEKVTSYIWQSTDVRAEWIPFSALPGIWLAPPFSIKSIWLTRFFLIRMWKAPLFWHSCKCVYTFFFFFFFEICPGCYVSWYSMNWPLYLSNYQQ